MFNEAVNSGAVVLQSLVSRVRRLLSPGEARSSDGSEPPSPAPQPGHHPQAALPSSACPACLSVPHPPVPPTTRTYVPTPTSHQGSLQRQYLAPSPELEERTCCLNTAAEAVTDGQGGRVHNSYRQTGIARGSNNRNGFLVTPSSGPVRGARAVKWLRPLGYCETLMTEAHEHGIMTTVYGLWLDSRQAINLSRVHQASRIMFRKMQHLRVTVGQREGEPWWREMEDEVVDVEEMVVEGGVEAAMGKLLRRRYQQHQGPLWFVRFFPLSECDDNHNDKFRYVCLFGFHHGVSDGTTNMAFCREFLQVLNGLLQGQEVDMAEVGYFAAPLHDRLADAASSWWWLGCILAHRFYQGVLTWGAHVRNFTKLFPMPAEREAATNLLHHELDENTSLKLFLRCRMEGVTVNSAFTAACNLALYKLMAAKRDSLTTARINCLHAVNMRRYWHKQQQYGAHGCHVSMIDLGFLTEERHLEEFWEYSREVHAVLKHQLSVAPRALVVQPISKHLNLVIAFNHLLSRRGFSSSNDNHYAVTNMGNLSNTFSGSGSEVEVTRILRTVSCHFMPTLCQHTLQTFRGRLSYSLDYYTQKLTRETASQYARGILHILTTAIHTPN